MDVGGARMLNFMTTWGDGLFDVYRDLDADGVLVRVRVELGTEERIEVMRQLERRERHEATLAEVSNRVWRDRAPIGFLYREKPKGSGDSGWRVFQGEEDDAARLLTRSPRSHCAIFRPGMLA